MKKKKHTKFLHDGEYAALVDVELICTDDRWSPYLSLDDAQKLDDVRAALSRGDIKKAGKFARVFMLMPIAA